MPTQQLGSLTSTHPSHQSGTPEQAGTPVPFSIPLRLRLRFMWWKLRYVALGFLLLVAFLAPSGSPSLTNQTFPVAAGALPLGHVLTQDDLVFPTGQPIANDSPTLVDQVLLVPLPKGSPVIPALVGPSVQLGLAPAGKVLVTTRLANPEILAYLQVGSTIDLVISGLDVEQVISRAAIVSLARDGLGTSGGDAWGQLPNSANSSDLSSTVLLAVSPEEARELALLPTWDTYITAVIVD